MKNEKSLKIKKKNEKLALESWISGKLINEAMPVRFTLNLNHKCNLKCKMCQFHRNLEESDFYLKEKEDFPKDLFKKFADEVFPTLIEAETTTVGEPFLYKYFKEVINKALEYNVRLYVTTNGTLFFEKIINDLISVLSTLVISIDAVDSNLYEKIRKGASFQVIKKNISKYIEIIASLNHEKKPEITFQMTLMHLNIAELPKMIKFAKEMGANNVKAYHAYIYDEDMKDESLFFHKELANHNFKLARILAQKERINLFIPKNFVINEKSVREINAKDFNKPPCRFLWTESFLEPTGDVSPCFFPTRFSIGNISNNTFYNIWNNERYQKLRQMVKLEPPIGYCNNCGLRYTYLNNYKGEGINSSQFLLLNKSQKGLYYNHHTKLNEK